MQLQHGEFNWATSVAMVRLSEAVYLTGPEFKDVCKEMGFPNSTFFDFKATDTQAGIAWDDTSVVLVYRGTSSIKDWLSDANFNQVATVEFPGEVHEGFYRCTASAMPIVDVVEKLAETRDLYVGGHSLGGALAALAMWLLRAAKPVGYTYGQPRVFDFAGAYEFDAVLGNKLYRTRNNNDVITRVPPGTRFKHVGRVIYYNRNGRFCILNKYQMVWDNLLGRLDNILKLFEKFRGTDGIVDHFMGAYRPITEEIERRKRSS